MKGELSSLDLHYLIKEFQVLIDAKIDKVFQHDNNFTFQLHVPNSGKKYLKILLPGFIYISDEKESFDESDKFALELRKHITNSRIRNTSQKEFERIIEIELESRGSENRLIIELFRPGNLILCDDNSKITIAKEYKGFGARLIRPKAAYEYPKKEFNFLDLSESDLMKLLDNTDKSSVVVTLAVNLGMGGLYSEELCIRAGIDGKKSKLNEREVMKLYASITQLKSMDTAPSVYFEGNSIIDIAPFELHKYSSFKCEEAVSFNSALGHYLSKKTTIENKNQKMEKFEKEKKKFETIIKNQHAQIKALEESAEENQKKGESIYERYAALNKILEELKNARAKYTWHEIKEKLKGHKVVKDINEKEKKITLEL